MPPARRRYRPWLPAARVCRASRSWDWCPFSGSVIAGRSARVQWLASLAAWFLTSRLSASDTTLTNHGADQQRAAFPLRKRRGPLAGAVLVVAAGSGVGSGWWWGGTVEGGPRGWGGGGIGGVLGGGAPGGATRSLTGGTPPCAGGLWARVWAWRNRTSRGGAGRGKSSPPLNDALFS